MLASIFPVNPCFNQYWKASGEHPANFHFVLAANVHFFQTVS